MRHISRVTKRIIRFIRMDHRLKKPLSFFFSFSSMLSFIQINELNTVGKSMSGISHPKEIAEERGKKQQICKPGSVLTATRSRSVCHLSWPCVTAWLQDLPPGIGRATLHAPVYMILQPIRRTACSVTAASGRLLPHLLTLTLHVVRTEAQTTHGKWRSFSSTLLYPHE